MKPKIHIFLMMVILITFSQAIAQRPFNKSKDILIAQFDSKPDPDDIHAQAALGSMLVHNDFAGVKFYAVAGAIGKQGGRFIDSDALFDMAFGNNWTDADANWSASVTRIKNKVKPILQNGGKVWVQEAGQSDITRDWIQALKNDGVASNTIKNNVVVVQHSKWNEDMTSNGDLNWVKSNANYKKIADGNGGGNGTPSYRSTNTSFLNQAKNSQNAKARALWIEADRVIQNHGHKPSHSSISTGGVDYSDCVENWWIFSIGENADNIPKFWSRYVTNATGSDPDPGNGSSTVTFKAESSNKYISSENGTKPMTAVRTSAQSWEKFTVSNEENGMVSIKGNNNKYVSSENGNKSMNCNRSAAQGWEKFTLEPLGGNVYAIKGNNGKYVSHENGNGPINCNRNTVGSWERFVIEGLNSAKVVNLAGTKLLDDQVTFFSNPVTRDNFSLKINTFRKIESASIQVIDITGKMVLSKELGILEQGTTSVSFKEAQTLKSGMYLVKVNLNERSMTSKIAIK